MPYVKTTFTEETMLDDFVNLAVENGWTLAKKFRKASYKFTGIFYGTPWGSEQIKQPFPLKIAEHAILKNRTGDLYGIARVCEKPLTVGDIPDKFKLNELPDQVKLESDDILRKELHDWMHEQWDSVMIDTSKIYFYMLDKEPNITAEAKIIYPSANANVRDVLDIELIDYVPRKALNTPGYEFLPTDEQAIIKQSPMVPVSTRDVGGDDNGWLTNWWPDSKLKVEGFINNETLTLIIRADATAAYDANQVPSFPVYFGRLVPLDPTDTQNASLFAGSAVPSGSYKYDGTTPFIPSSSILMPTNKAYPQNPGNGIDNVIVKRAEQGAYYQAYYLTGYMGPEKMPPDRQDDSGRQFPSAWKNEANDEYTYPPVSSYSNKAAVSRAMVMHPEERQRGYLKNIILAESVGPRNNTRLKVKKAACPDVFEFYKYFVVDAVSPVTKKPAVAYRPMAIGIFEKEE
ncbi:hypothetical protein [Bacillus sp. PK3_68]|uniref:hypothetical protein n=1 Tax=Bacillus sp. PK3_68 TaxID=2027408 RepID=UPI000E7675E9|nr:hypothetical protein [Bacillus sp. PK3_68]RJS60107.1 hypothetical protein CJ483_08560 [Bacillus sp. PK3_68]